MPIKFNMILDIVKIVIVVIKATWPVWVIALSFMGIGFLGEWWIKRKEKKELQKWLYQEHTLEEWKEV